MVAESFWRQRSMSSAPVTWPSVCDRTSTSSRRCGVQRRPRARSWSRAPAHRLAGMLAAGVPGEGGDPVADIARSISGEAVTPSVIAICCNSEPADQRQGDTMPARRAALIAFALVAFGASPVASQSPVGSAPIGAPPLGWQDELTGGPDKLDVATTVAPISSLARNIGGDRIRLHGLVPDATNSHTFEPSPSDAKVLANADLIIVNGLHLEQPTLELAEASKRAETPIKLLGDATVTEDEWLFDFS